MPVMQLINGDATTTAQVAQAAGDATVQPVSIAGFPSSPQFTIRNQRTGELMLVTAINTGPPVTWSITRGFGGSAAGTITAGDGLEYSLTREMLLGGFVAKLDEITLVANQATFDLNVPTWATSVRTLEVELVGRCNFVGNHTTWCVRLNGDTSASYDYEQWWASGLGLSQSGAYATANCAMGWATGTTGQAGQASPITLKVFDASRAVWGKQMLSTAGISGAGSSGNLLAAGAHGRWRTTTAAVTRLTFFFTDATQWLTDTTATLYGKP